MAFHGNKHLKQDLNISVILNVENVTLYVIGPNSIFSIGQIILSKADKPKRSKKWNRIEQNITLFLNSSHTYESPSSEDAQAIQVVINGHPRETGQKTSSHEKEHFVLRNPGRDIFPLYLSEKKFKQENQKINSNNIISRLDDLLCRLLKKIRNEIETRKTERKLKQHNISFKRLIMSFVQLTHLV